MDETTLTQRIEAIEAKLDVILGEMELQRQQRRMIEDLRDDLTRVATDVFRDTVHEMDDLTYTLDTRDFTALAKQLLRNVNNLRLAFQQLESARDFLADFTRISGPLFSDVLHKLDGMDRQGYFELMQSAGKAAESAVEDMNPEDIGRLTAVMPVMVRAGSRFMTPGVLESIDRAADAFERYEFDADRKVGMLELIKLMNDPEVRKGMAYTLGMFREMVRAVDGTTGS